MAFTTPLSISYHPWTKLSIFVTFNVSDKRTSERNDSLPLKESSSKSMVSSPAGVTSLPGLALTSLLAMDAGKTNIVCLG